MKLNKCYFIGRLTRDPETFANNSVCSFTVATSRKFKTNQGEERQEVAYIPVKAFGRQAETAAKYKKGSEVVVDGRFVSESWQDQSGQQKSKLVVYVEMTDQMGAPAPAQGGYGSAPNY